MVVRAPVAFVPVGRSALPPVEGEANHQRMWVDQRGSEILGLAECRRLLALGAKEKRPGHVGIPQEHAPLVLPVDYQMDGSDVIVLVGDHLSAEMTGARAVALQVDGLQEGRSWSVLVRGPALEASAASIDGDLPSPSVAEPGRSYVRIRADVVTGRRLR